MTPEVSDVGSSWQQQWARAEEILAKLREDCATPDERLRLLVDDMVSEMRAGLHGEDDARSSLKMLPSHVKRLPSGRSRNRSIAVSPNPPMHYLREEEGLFYALDLGGTNFRVLRVLLQGRGHHVIQPESKQFSIPNDLMIGTSDKLFDFIAAKLADFIKEENLDLPVDKQRELGFTFSFPIKQHSVASGFLIKWTKGFSIADMVGKDVTIELSKALKRHNLDMHVAALVNDTVGTLAAGRYRDKYVILAVILGTGTNAAYVETEDSVRESGGMVINMEWGNFFSSSLPITEYDQALDRESFNPGEQVFEKLISGMFLGDIVRRVLLKMAEEAKLFGEFYGSEIDDQWYLKKLHVHSILRTVDMNAMHHDTTFNLCTVESKLKEIFEISGTWLETRKVVVEICDIIAKRAARLAAAGIAGVLKKLGSDLAGSSNQKTVIAIDGALFEHYTIFSECLQSTLEVLLGEEAWKMIELKLTKDGSGIGAALLAASHSQCR